MLALLRTLLLLLLLLGLLLVLHLQLLHLLCQLFNGICCRSRGLLSGHGWGSLGRCGVSWFILSFLLLDLLSLLGLLLLLARGLFPQEAEALLEAELLP